MERKRYAAPELSQAEVMEKIKKDLECFLGSKMRFKANLGRCKVIEREGILEEIHPNLFVMRVDEKRNRSRRVSYSYADILTRSVELSHIRSRKNVLPWLIK
jgi:uncharacterized protein Veg